MAEAVMVATAGSTLGLGVLYGSLWLFHRQVDALSGIPLLVHGPSQRVLASAALTIASAAILAVLPAWRAYRNSLLDGLHAT